METIQSFKARAHLLKLLGDELIGDDRLAVFELVKNAYDADATEVKVTLDLEREKPRIVVTDNGCGMDQEVRRLAFTTFFTTKGSGGTGLGLLLTRKIVQEHGGRIALETTPGEGSVFRLIFPRDRLPKPEPLPDDESANGSKGE